MGHKTHGVTSHTPEIYFVCLCVCVRARLCVCGHKSVPHIIQVIVTTAISFDEREKGSGGVNGDSWGPSEADSGRLCGAAGSMKKACDIDLMLPRGSLPTSSSAPSLQRMRRSRPRHANNKSRCSVSVSSLTEFSVAFLFFSLITH